MNLIEQIIVAVLGDQYSGLLENVDPNLLFLGSIFLLYFSYLILRSLLRTFLNIRFT